MKYFQSIERVEMRKHSLFVTGRSGETDCSGCLSVKEGGDSRKGLKTTLTTFPLFGLTKDLKTLMKSNYNQIYRSNYVFISNFQTRHDPDPSAVISLKYLCTTVNSLIVVLCYVQFSPHLLVD